MQDPCPGATFGKMAEKQGNGYCILQHSAVVQLLVMAIEHWVFLSLDAQNS